MGTSLKILVGVGLFWLGVLLVGAYFDGAFASAGATMRPGKWTNEIELADFDSDVGDGQLDAELQQHLTSPWGLEDGTSKTESVCLGEDDVASFGKLGKAPDPPGWSKSECEFTRRNNRGSSLDTAVLCRSDDGKREQRMALTGTLGAEEARFRLVGDDRFKIADEVQTAHWEIVTKSVRVGECD